MGESLVYDALDRAGDALVNLREVHLLPFYYHYHTTETLAAQSLLATVVMYPPVGAGY